MRYFFLSVSVVLLAGCGTASSDIPAKSKPKHRATTSVDKVEKPPAPTVDANAFADVNEAIEVLKIAAETGRQDERLKVTAWLAMQGAPAVEALTKELEATETREREKIALCRALGRIASPAAIGVLIRTLSTDKQMVRLNATDQLGLVDPSTSEIVTALIRQLDHEDDRSRQHAIRALAKIGRPARRSVDKLVAILNSDQDKVLRDEASKALKIIDKRVTFDTD